MSESVLLNKLGGALRAPAAAATHCRLRGHSPPAHTTREKEEAAATHRGFRLRHMADGHQDRYLHTAALFISKKARRHGPPS